MFLHSPFSTEKVSKITSFLKTQSFATFVTINEIGIPVASHLPVNLCPDDESEYGKVITHLARGNPHYSALQENTEILIIYLSDNSYISPSFFKNKASAPTQAFTAVHIYGKAKVITDKTDLKKLMTKQVQSREESMTKPWSMAELGDDGIQKRFNQIAGIEITIDRVEANFHLLQDEETANIEGILKNANLSDNMKERIHNENK